MFRFAIANSSNGITLFFRKAEILQEVEVVW